jgi:hypothetical protein
MKAERPEIKPKAEGKPKAPGQLSPKAAKLWHFVMGGWELDEGTQAILVASLENLDLADEARALLRKEGLILAGKAHPAAALAKQYDGVYARMWRQIGLEPASQKED